MNASFPYDTERRFNGVIKSFIETSLSDWPGKIAAVVFLGGCNFRCGYCHNYPLVLSADKLQSVPFEKVAAALKRHQGWIDGVCITGGEPTLYPHLKEMISAIRELHADIKLDTNGSRPEVLTNLLAENNIAYVAMDLKAPLNDMQYSRVAGVPVSAAKIRRSLKLLIESGVELEVRSTIIPPLHTREDIFSMAREARGAKRFTLQNFNPRDPLDPALKSISPFAEEELAVLREECRLILEA